ncbi:hypothetical protein ATANTOWER_018448 [Ataeniobius toweri]|uniref:Uncharacterized protein n=1 Tax=Ataeniobius toweri TaxID=208326 RepID=A0ABU7BN08_9TELE|nr:hypothetical protein [Ataeniobius toweri]
MMEFAQLSGKVTPWSNESLERTFQRFIERRPKLYITVQTEKPCPYWTDAGPAAQTFTVPFAAELYLISQLGLNRSWA